MAQSARTRIAPTSSKSRLARFAVTFALCLFLGFALLLTHPVQVVDLRLDKGLVSLSRALIQGCGGRVFGEGAILRSAAGFAVEMKDGCNGSNVLILLWSAMLAFPASWRIRTLGLVGGTLFIQFLNFIRFISLFYLGQYSITWFNFAHRYLWESLLVLDTLVVFWIWVRRYASSPPVFNAGR